MGVLTATMAAGNLAGALPAGQLIRRRGLPAALLVCLIAAPTVLGARSLSTDFRVQIGLAFLTGLSLSIWAVCVSPATAALTTDRQRPLAFSLVFSLGIGVGAAGALAGSRMPGFFSRILGNAAVLAPDQLTLIGACCIAAVAFIPAVRLHIHGAAIPSQRPGVLSTPAVRRILPAIGIWGLVTGSFAPFGNVFLAGHVRMSLHSVGTVFSTSQLCQVAAVLCAPLVFRRIGVPNGVFTMQMATACCFILLALTVHPVLAGITYVALMGMQYMGEPGIYSMMMSVVPEETRGGASAAMALVLGASQLIAAGSAGWMFTALGYPRALGIIAGFAIIAGLLFRTVGYVEGSVLIPCADERGA
jgi:hypothetical protein